MSSTILIAIVLGAFAVAGVLTVLFYRDQSKAVAEPNADDRTMPATQTGDVDATAGARQP